MKASDRRKMMREEMQKRQEENYSRKDDSGKFHSIFKDDVKKDMKWKCSTDDHIIDILPYIAGTNNPTVKEGKPTYILDIWVHRKVGVNENDYVCLNKTYNEECPICEYQNELRKKVRSSEDPESFDDEIKALNPTRRAIYNVRSLDKKDDPDEVKIWDVSHYLFEKELLEYAKNKRSGGFILFADPDQGRSIAFRKIGKEINTKYTAFEFLERDEPISDELLDSTHCLDELIHLPTYEEVQGAFLGRSSVEEKRIVKEEEEEKRPSKKETKKAKAEPEPEPEPEDDVPPFDEDECPEGFVFGEDNNKYEECETCDNYENCETKSREIRMARRQAKAKVEKVPEKEADASRASSRRRRA